MGTNHYTPDVAERNREAIMPETADVVIRPIEASDRRAWEPLWASYLSFYERTVARDVTEFTWTRLTSTREVRGLIAIGADGGALGVVHYLFHASTWNMGGNCYLQDLFVTPASRGRRIGRRLIEAVVQAAKKEGAAVVYWQTEEFNGTARRLYERVAKRSPFVRYDVAL